MLQLKQATYFLVQLIGRCSHEGSHMVDALVTQAATDRLYHMLLIVSKRLHVCRFKRSKMTSPASQLQVWFLFIFSDDTIASLVPEKHDLKPNLLKSLSVNSEVCY
ncbi:hypothetical protein Lser_V15G06243 [Lactuca serriola]